MDRLSSCRTRGDVLSVDVGYAFEWVLGGVAYPCSVEARCFFCTAPAVVRLPPPLREIQPDDTTHVCHPGFGGCNHGFAVTTDVQPKERK